MSLYNYVDTPNQNLVRCKTKVIYSPSHHVRYAASVGTCRHHACRREDASIPPEILQNRYNRGCGLSLTFAVEVCNRLVCSTASTCDVVSADSTLVRRARRRWATVLRANALMFIRLNQIIGEATFQPTRVWKDRRSLRGAVTVNISRCITECPGISAPAFPFARL